jgi:hypothetical protein
MAKQIKLKVEDENELTIFGIVSQESDLKITWALNKAIGLKLSRAANIQSPKNIPEEGFPVYLYDNEQNQLKYTFLINRAKGVNLVTSLKNIDYLLILKGAISVLEKKDFISKIKQLPEIASIIDIDADKVKERDMLSMF